MDYYLGKLMNSLRTKRGISTKELARGLCTDRTLLDIEKDIETPENNLLKLLLERLGMSYNKFEVIIDENTYANELTQLELDRAIGRKDWKIANHYLLKIERRSSKKKPVSEMIIYRNRANFEYASNESGKAVTSIKKAICATITGWPNVSLKPLVLSITELENILIYVILKVISAKEEGQKLHIELMPMIEEVSEYIDHNSFDEECLAVILPKLAYAKALLYKEMGMHKEIVSECLKGLTYLRKHEILFLARAMLKLIVDYGERYSEYVDEEYKDYCGYLNAIEHVIAEYPDYSSDLFFDSPFLRCNKTLYHIDRELIRGLRRQKRLTQADISNKIYKNTESYSRAESGKTSMNHEFFKALLQRLKLKNGRYNLSLLCLDFETFDRMNETAILALKGSKEEAAKSLAVLEAELDTSLELNRDALFWLKSAMERDTTQEVENELKARLNKYYPVLDPRVRRTPFLNEARAVALFGLRLYNNNKKEDLLQLYGRMLDSFKDSKVAHEFQYKTYGLTAGNYAAVSMQDADAVCVIKNMLSCGSISYLDVCMFILGLNKAENNLQDVSGKQLIEDSYYLSKFALDLANLERLKRNIFVLPK